MTSLFAQLYLAIQAHIKTNVPAIKWIDQDLGQLEIADERPPVIFPCVLIDFATAQYTEESQGFQWAAITISIRLGFAPFSSASSAAPLPVQEKALEYYEIENQLYAALQGFTADDCIQPMVRVSAASERREDTYRVRELLFTTATEDDTVQVPINKVKGSLNLDLG